MEQTRVKIIADSISEEGVRITTWELEYPRYIHGEVMTHRVFSRNAASSRAIPINSMIELIENDVAMPVSWGMNKSGMQAEETHSSSATCEYAWKKAAKSAIEHAKALQGLGLHKQICNRVIEPFQRMKTVVTATSFDNWFHLRNHSDAQPEIADLAKKMYDAHKENTPQLLESGMWHLPYIQTYICPEYGNVVYHLGDEDLTDLTLEEATKVSASCCAQVSYRKSDDSLEKALKIWDMLVNMQPVHASPFEHQATPMKSSLGADFDFWEEGVTHLDDEGVLHSGNFKGWIQHRQLIPNHECNNYEGDK